MTTARRVSLVLLAILAAILLLMLARSASGEDFAFMPKGGRALLVELPGAAANPAELRGIVRSRRTDAEWRSFVDAHGAALSEHERATLAAYLALNMPVTEDTAKRGDLAANLPPDGRDLAWNECQSCHPLFAGYLTQDRDAQGWRNIFLSPFHRQMKLSPQEREEFARYSALNMPMKIESVPQDMRF